MSDTHASPPAESKVEGTIKKWINWRAYNLVTGVWNNAGSKIFGKFNKKTMEGTFQTSVIYEELKTLFTINNNNLGRLAEIEKKWGEIETLLFGPANFHFDKDKINDSVFSDLYRRFEYFRDPGVAEQEAKLFRESGTISFDPIEVQVDRAKILRMAHKTIGDLQRKIAEIEAIPPGERTDPQNGELSDKREALAKTQELIDDPDTYISSVSVLKKILLRDVPLPFVDGRVEKVFAIGKNNISSIIGDFNSLNNGIDHFASSSNLPASLRTPINNLMRGILDSLKEIEKRESGHGAKVEKISVLLKQAASIVNEGIGESNRPLKNLIRFCHTYKIIKPYKVVKMRDRAGIERIEVKKFKEEYPHFARNDEVEPGKDEYGWPLEVYEHNGSWYVLLDKWWSEICENDWQENTIKRKAGGVRKWNEKIENGVKVPIRNHTVPYRANRCHIRKVPEEWVGHNLHNLSESGIVDIDPLEKLSYISNETDAFRDDFRDGRFHKHSKSSMDYIIAGSKGITPSVPIAYGKNLINTESNEIRIKFKPIYYTKANFGVGELNNAQKRLIGEVNPGGGLGQVSTRNIPNDERRVSRKYDQYLPNQQNPQESIVQPDQIRTPTHLNPGFDRAALDHEFIHWGRMLYYETTDGINRWSENPFPHVSTRGLAKYVIDLVIRNSFSWNDARNTLKRPNKEHGWDYGIRHYGDPFIRDPLGPEGVLEHKKFQEAKKGGGH